MTSLESLSLRAFRGEPTLGHPDCEPLPLNWESRPFLLLSATQSVGLCYSPYDNGTGTWVSQLPL